MSRIKEAISGIIEDIEPDFVLIDVSPKDLWEEIENRFFEDNYDLYLGDIADGEAC